MNVLYEVTNTVDNSKKDVPMQLIMNTSWKKVRKQVIVALARKVTTYRVKDLAALLGESTSNISELDKRFRGKIRASKAATLYFDMLLKNADYIKQFSIESRRDSIGENKDKVISLINEFLKMPKADRRSTMYQDVYFKNVISEVKKIG